MLVKILLFTSILWLCIHGISRRLSRKSSVLPFDTSTSRTRQHSYHHWHRHTSLTVRYLHLRLQTTRWNSTHDAFATKLAHRRSRRLAPVLRAVYDVGSMAGLIGMFLALGYLVWTLARTALSLLPPSYTNEPGRLSRRSLDEFSDNRDHITTSTANSIIITPIIPGVTVPLSHLPIILVAVFYSQVVHELGHAIAAAVENLPVTSVGVSLTVVLPAAFVGFSNGLFDALSPRSQSRITAAGPFHNLILWLIFIFMGWSGAGNIFVGIAGYKDMHSIGPVVVGVNEASPLYHILIPGTIMTMLDDTNLGSEDPLADIWTSYLTSPLKQQTPLGWCVKEDTLSNSESCCSPSNDGKDLDSRLSCFNLLDSGNKKTCIDPVPILTQPAPRCKTVDSCSVGQTCIQPSTDEHLLRLTLQRPDTGEPQTIVWSGPSIEVWEEVEISRFASLSPLAPIWLPNYFNTLWQYTKMATLSLFFLNLLPLPHLDGNKLLKSTLDMTFAPDALEGEIYDIEALETLEGKRKNNSHWKQRLEKYVPWITLCMVVICALLAMVNI